MLEEQEGPGHSSSSPAPGEGLGPHEEAARSASPGSRVPHMGKVSELNGC